MIIQFNGKTVSFGDKLVKLDTSKKWSLPVHTTEGWVDDGAGWYTFSLDADDNRIKINLNEGSETDYHFAKYNFGTSLNLSKDPTMFLTMKGGSNPTVLFYLVDINGNKSRYLNVGSNSDKSKLVLMPLTANTHTTQADYGSIPSSSKTMDVSALSDYVDNTGFDNTQVVGIEICIANWYQEPEGNYPEWKSRDKNVVITELKITE